MCYFRLQYACLFSFLFVLYSTMVHAQDNEPYIYGEVGGGDGTHGLVQLTQNVVFSYNNVISVSYCYASREAPNTPWDYSPGSFDIPRFPQVSLSTLGVSYGRMIFTNSDNVRYILRGGLCAGTVREPYNFERFSALFNSSYTYSRDTKFVMGLVLNPVVEFPVAGRFGFSAGPYINLNPSSPVFSIEVSMMFGKVKSARRK